jgi:hypothetical protein
MHNILSKLKNILNSAIQNLISACIYTSLNHCIVTHHAVVYYTIPKVTARKQANQIYTNIKSLIQLSVYI